jgi:hypothetical protein
VETLRDVALEVRALRKELAGRSEPAGPPRESPPDA